MSLGTRDTPGAEEKVAALTTPHGTVDSTVDSTVALEDGFYVTAQPPTQVQR